MKRLTQFGTRARTAMTLLFCAALCMVADVARATDVDLFDTAGTEIAANKSKLITLLGVIFTIVIAFVAFKLVKRGTNKV